MALKKAEALGPCMPSVFISYAQGSDENESRVDALVATLSAADLDVVWDGNATVREGLAAWMEDSLRRVDWILVICDELYVAKLLGTPTRTGRGVKFEYAEMRREIFLRDSVNERIIPVGFGPYDERRIPPVLQDTPYYDVSDEATLEALVAHLRVPRERPPAVAEEEIAEVFEARFRRDIERLESTTNEALLRLSARRSFTVHGQRISVDMPEINEIVGSSSRISLIVGEPGSGKSAIIAAVAEALRSQGVHIVILDADALEDGGDTRPLRDRLGLRYDIPTILSEWRDEQPKVLFVDALDVARSSASARQYRDLILRVANEAPEWRIVVSIRRYEFDNGRQLRQILQSVGGQGTGPSQDTFLVAPLSEQILATIASESNRLASFFDAASDEARSLVRNPFNLSLCAAVLDSAQHADLRVVQTQYQLLALYWSSRIDPAIRPAPVAALQCLIGAMLADRRTSALRDLAGQDAIEALLSAGVIVEADYGGAAGSWVRFRHRLLFDYAVDRVIFLSAPGGIVPVLSQVTDAILLLYSAIRLHFEGAWFDKRRFWADAHQLEAASISSAASTVAPVVAAEEMSTLEDILPLLSGNGSQSLISRFVRAADRYALTEARREAMWPILSEFLGRLWASGDAPLVAFELLWRLRHKLKDAPVPAMVGFAGTARSMLGHALLHRAESHGEWQARIAIETVAETFDTDATASAIALRPILASDYLSRFGYADARWLAWHFGRVWKSNPSFAVDVYRAFFAFDERDVAKTSMSAGVLAMVSNRAQDYESAIYALGDHFSKFAVEHIVEAAAIVGPAAQRHNRTLLRESHSIVISCPLRNWLLKIEYDGSEIWDGEGSLDPSSERKMLASFSDAVLAAADDDRLDLDAVLDEAAQSWVTAAPWRRLLQVGSLRPNNVGIAIFDLASRPEVLEHPALTEAAIECLASIATLLSVEDRKLLVSRLDGIRRKRPGLVSRVGAALPVGMIPEAWLCPTPETPATLEVGTHAVTVEDLIRLSAGGKRSENARLLERIRSIDPFTRALGILTDEERPAAVEALSMLLTELHTADKGDAAYDVGWSVASGVARRLAEHHKDNLSQADLQLVRSTLMRASYERQPVPDAKMDAQFAQSQSWGSPSARIDAVLGLIALWSPNDQEILDRLFAMADDDRADVRYLIITNAARLGADNAWHLVEHLIGDPNAGVITGLVGHALPRLWSTDKERATELVLTTYEKIRRSNEIMTHSMREALLSMVEYLAIVEGNERALAAVEALLYAPSANGDDATALVFLMARRMELLLRADTYNEFLALRIASYLQRCLETATTRSLELLYAPVASPAATQEEHDAATLDAKRIAEIASRLYFASGAFAPQGVTRAEATPRFYPLAKPLLSILSRWPIPPVLHNVVLILDLYLIMDPRECFLIFASAIATGQRFGFERDSLAFSPIAAFVERCLADYSELLESDGELRTALVTTADILADAGLEPFQDVVAGLQRLYE